MGDSEVDILQGLQHFPGRRAQVCETQSAEPTWLRHGLCRAKSTAFGVRQTGLNPGFMTYLLDDPGKVASSL